MERTVPRLTACALVFAAAGLGLLAGTDLVGPLELTPWTRGLTPRDAVVRLGAVGQNETHEVVNEVRNGTDQTFRFVISSKQCSCTEVVVDRQEVPPGEACRVTLVWKTGRKLGPVRLPVTLLYEPLGAQESGLVSTHFEVEAEVQPDFTVEPSEAVLDGVRPTQLRLVAGRRRPPHLLGVDASSPAVRGRVLDAATFEVGCDGDVAAVDGHYVLVRTSDAPQQWPMVFVRASTSRR